MGIDKGNKEEKEQAIKGILRLQKTYKIPTSSIAEGKILDYLATEKLGVDDLYDIGVMALRTEQLGGWQGRFNWCILLTFI